jgi:hypothetical protein
MLNALDLVLLKQEENGKGSQTVYINGSMSEIKKENFWHTKLLWILALIICEVLM